MKRICLYVYICAYVYVCMRMSVYTCIYICMCVYMYILAVCTYMYIYIYIYIYYLTFCQLSKNMTSSAQPAFTCSKLTIETLEQGVKYVQS